MSMYSSMMGGGGGGGNHDGINWDGIDALRKKKRKDPPTPPAPVPNPGDLPVPWDWNASTGRPTMDFDAVFGGLLPLAGVTAANNPMYNSPAPPVSGNFWNSTRNFDTFKDPYSALIAMLSGNPFSMGGQGKNSPMGGRGGGNMMEGGGPAGQGMIPGKNKGKNGMNMGALASYAPFDAFYKTFGPTGISPQSNTGMIPFY